MFPSGPLQYKEVLHLCRWYTHTHSLLSQTTPWHTILGHTLTHAILAQTAFLRPLLFHTTLSPTAISRTTLYHTHHFYTPLHTLLSPTTLLHGTLSHTSLRYGFLHTPILHHLLSLSCLSHPIFTFLWLLVGRSWCGVIRSFNYDVLVLFDIQQQRLGEYSIQHRARMESHEMLREVFSMSCTCFTGRESLNKPHHIAMMQVPSSSRMLFTGPYRAWKIPKHGPHLKSCK